MAVFAPAKPKNPFPKKEAAVPNMPPTMARIIRPEAAFRWTGQMLASWTPQMVEMTLRSALAGDHVRAWELFDLMEDSWPRLRKNAQEVVNAVQNLTPTFEPFCEEEEEATSTAEERAKLVSAALRTMRPDPTMDEHGLDGLIRDILDARLKGVSLQEIGWERRPAGSLGDIVAPRAAWWVHPSCYGWSTEGRLGLREVGSAAMSEFPPDKFVIAVCKTKTGSPLGGALLRPLAWWWCAANFSADWLLNLAQVFGLPFRWANYEANASQTTVDAICDMLANMGSAGWAAFPAGTTLELKAEGQKSGDATPQGNMLDRADKQCDLLILGQTLTTDSGGGGKGGGSLALGKVHEGVKYEIVTSAAKFVSRVVNEQLIPAILRLNYDDETEAPTLCLESEDEADLQKDASIIQTLTSAGAGEIISLDWLGKKFAIPKPGAAERTLGSVKAEAAEKAAERLRDAETGGRGDGEKKEAPESLAKLEAISRIADDTAFDQALKAFASDALAAGDFAGHPFRGNQWTKRGKIRAVIDAEKDGSNEAVIEKYHAVTEAEAARLKTEAGVDVAGYEHALDNYSVRHIKKEHTGPREAKRGQVEITDEDFERLPEIVTDWDKAVNAGKTKTGRETIRYEKRIGDNYFLVEEVRTKRKTLIPISFYKRRATPDAQAPAQTS